MGALKHQDHIYFEGLLLCVRILCDFDFGFFALVVKLCAAVILTTTSTVFNFAMNDNRGLCQFWDTLIWLFVRDLGASSGFPGKFSVLLDAEITNHVASHFPCLQSTSSLIARRFRE